MRQCQLCFAKRARRLVGGLVRHLPLRILDNAAILGPTEPVRARAKVFRPFQNPHDLCRVAARRGFSDAPDSEVSIMGLHCQHI